MSTSIQDYPGSSGRSLMPLSLDTSDSLSKTAYVHDNAGVKYLNVETGLPLAQDGSLYCRICGSCFGRSGELKFHMLKFHADIENKFPFECQKCGKGFFSKAGLTCHNESHSAKLECPFCGRSFSYSRSWRRHIEFNHNQKECRYCKRFVFLEEFEMHVSNCSKS